MDLSQTIIPKSDQLNADDLITGPRTIRITKIEIKAGEQPVSIFFEGDNGKPWKPCKSMLRVLVHVWGSDSSSYIGRSAKLALDSSVTWGGRAVGGIRITHLSDLPSDSVTIALTASKGIRKPFTVTNLQAEFDRDATLAKLEAAAEKGPEILKEEWLQTKGRRLIESELPRLKELAAKTSTLHEKLSPKKQ